MLQPALDRFQELVERAGLRRARRAHLYRISEAGNRGYLDLNPFGGVLGVQFAPTLGVVSARLSEVIGPVTQELPEAYVHHWFRSFVYIHDEHEDLFWEVTEDPSTWEAPLSDLETRVLPALLEHLTDSGLVRCWSEHEDPWLPPVARLTYAAILAGGRASDEGGRLVEQIEAILGASARDGFVPGLDFARSGLEHLGLSLPPEA
jgi:hypothetical protein